MKRNKIIYIILGIIVVLIISITIGYSAFGTEMNISGIAASVRLEENIRVTGLSVESTVDNASSSYEDYNIAALLTEITLPTATSQITYKVTVTNFGNIEMGILNIENLPENLEYELTDYKLQDKVCDTNNKCTLGAQKVFYLTITYLNIDSTSYPQEIMEETNLQLTFQEPFPKHLMVYNESNVTVPFVYENGILTVEKVTENLTVENLIELEDKDFIIENDSEIEIWEKIPDGSSITIDDLLNSEMSGINISNKKIIQIDVIIEYQSSTGSTQNINVLLDDTNNSYSQNIVFTRAETSATASFPNLSLDPNSEFKISLEEGKLTNHSININKVSIKVYFEE